MSLYVRKNGYNLFDREFDNLFGFKNSYNVLKTNVEEKENEYEFTVEVPGFKKDDINISLDRGYLKIEASKSESSEKKFIRKEIKEGTYTRAFYIGDVYNEENINASFNNGLLYINIPKVVEKENKKIIEIK